MFVAICSLILGSIYDLGDVFILYILFSKKWHFKFFHAIIIYIMFIYNKRYVIFSEKILLAPICG